MIQRVTPANFTNQDWLQAMREFHKGPIHTACGACRACQDAPAPKLPDVAARPRHLEVHAFEMLTTNTAWLRWAFELFRVNGNITQAVVSNITRRNAFFVPRPSRARLGMENGLAFASSTAIRARHQSRFEHMNTISLDDYISRNRIGHVHLISIDTEGFDALVLEGLDATLSKGAVDLVSGPHLYLRAAHSFATRRFNTMQAVSPYICIFVHAD